MLHSDLASNGKQSLTMNGRMVLSRTEFEMWTNFIFHPEVQKFRALFYLPTDCINLLYVLCTFLTTEW